MIMPDKSNQLGSNGESSKFFVPSTESSKFAEGGQTTNISSLFEYDRDQEQARLDPGFQTIDQDDIEARESVSNEEKNIPKFRNPWIKGGVVVGAVATFIGSCWLLFAQTTKTIAPVATKPETTAEKFDGPTVGESQLKGQVALDQQNAMLNRKKLPATQTPVPVATPAVTAAAPAVGTTQPVARPAEKPVLVTASKPIASQPIQTTNPYRPTPPVRYPSPRPTQIAYQSPAKSTIKPVAKTAQTTQFTSRPTKPKQAIAKPYTPVTIVKADPIKPVDLSAPLSWQQQSTEGTFGGRYSRGGSTGGEATQVTNTAILPSPIVKPSSPYLESENEIFRTNRQNTVLAGVKALGLLLAPIQMAGGDTSEQTTVVGLNQPLLDRQGAVVVPAGSQIQFKFNVLPNGWVKISSAAINIRGEQTNIPGTFSLIAENGQPLVAQSLTFGEDKVAKQDQRNFIFGALQNIGAVLTQPNTQSTISSGVSGVTSSSSSQSNPSVIGAVLQGGFNPLAQQQMSRSAAEINQLLNAPKLWFLPAGTNIQIITNQPITF
jgi:hypothetical protein